MWITDHSYGAHSFPYTSLRLGGSSPRPRRAAGRAPPQASRPATSHPSVLLTVPSALLPAQRAPCRGHFTACGVSLGGGWSPAVLGGCWAPACRSPVTRALGPQRGRAVAAAGSDGAPRWWSARPLAQADPPGHTLLTSPSTLPSPSSRARRSPTPPLKSTYSTQNCSPSQPRPSQGWELGTSLIAPTGTCTHPPHGPTTRCSELLPQRVLPALV